jgi:NAD(P)-dependent dehydrogenase (short-subunit alcohol dehydrogenase family)
LKELQGKVAIVAGGARGIGFEIAKSISRFGTSVVIADLRIDLAQKAVEEICRQNGDGLAIQTDVSNWKAVKRMVTLALDRYRHVDILINNAGIDERMVCSKPSHYRIEKLEREWSKIIDVNLESAFFCCKAVVEHMKARAFRSFSVVHC